MTPAATEIVSMPRAGAYDAQIPTGMPAERYIKMTEAIQAPSTHDACND
jgi:hypothetical protein